MYEYSFAVWQEGATIRRLRAANELDSTCRWQVGCQMASQPRGEKSHGRKVAARPVLIGRSSGTIHPLLEEKGVLEL